MKQEEVEQVPTETFMCDCHDRDHIIIASYYAATSEDDIGDEIYLTFKTRRDDSEADKFRWNKHPMYRLIWIDFTNIFRRARWRIKTALKILFTGYIELESSWIPARNGLTSIDNGVASSDDGIVFGYSTLQQFIDWLSKVLEASKKNDAIRLAEWKKTR